MRKSKQEKKETHYNQSQPKKVKVKIDRNWPKGTKEGR
jgi:hypothetical protein